MSFSKVKPSGWAFGEKLTSAQMNTLDTDHANALDKVGGDTIGSSVVISWSGTNYPFLASRTEVRVQMLVPASSNPGATNWVTVSSPTCWAYSGLAAEPLEFWLNNFVDGATLAQVRMWIKGASGHAGLPALMPQLSVYRIDVAAHSEAQLGSTATDGSGSVGAYEAIHSVSVSGLTETITESNSRMYRVTVRPEGSTNAVAFMRLVGIDCLFTCTSLRPGG